MIFKSINDNKSNNNDSQISWRHVLRIHYQLWETWELMTSTLPSQSIRRICLSIAHRSAIAVKHCICLPVAMATRVQGLTRHKAFRKDMKEAVGGGSGNLSLAQVLLIRFSVTKRGPAANLNYRVSHLGSPHSEPRTRSWRCFIVYQRLVHRPQDT